MLRGFGKYKLAYGLLWETYGSSWFVRISYVLQIAARICRLIFLPIAVSLIIAHLSAHNFIGAQRAVLLFVVISLVAGVITPLIKYIAMLGENEVYITATAQYFSRFVATDLDYFNSNQAGYLTTATRQYGDSALTLVRNVRDKYIPTILSITFPLLVIAWLDPWLGLVALALSSLQAVYLFWASSTIGPFRIRSREMYKRNSGLISDVISNILAVRASAQEQTYVARMRNGMREESDAFHERYVVQVKLLAAREFIGVVFFMVLLGLTVERMQYGHIAITAAVLVVTYMATILTGIYSLSEDMDEHDDLIDKVIPAFDILHRTNAVQDPSKPVALRRVNGGIHFDHVSFAYHEQKGSAAVFTDFSLDVPAGQKVGVVGLSGAGKSTLTKLLLRFNDVTSGAIRVDGVDIRTMRQTDLRQHIAYVPQEPLLFHASIRENILLGRPDASDTAIDEALHAAHATQFIDRLSDGIESIVGERGVKLSGGQKQRIAIARAVLQDAPIIVLDEATSALDSESEQIIKDSFASILRGRTAIIVAHRLSTLSEMDRIIVIDQGTLIEDGTHTSLLRHDGVYARLWRRQQKNLDDSGDVPSAVLQFAEESA